MQPDTIIPDLSNPQSWNRFSYVNNSPVNRNDPSGHCSVAVNMGVFGGQIEIKISDNPCPWDKPTEPGHDVVVTVPIQVYDGPDMPVPQIPKWGLDVINLNELDIYDGPDLLGQDRPLVFMDGSIRRPPKIKSGSSDGEKTGSGFSDAVRRKALEEDPTQTCVFCGRTGKGTDLDHIIPKNKGGDDTLNNAQWACPHCNRSKQDSKFPKSPPSDYEGPWPPKWWDKLGGVAG